MIRSEFQPDLCISICYTLPAGLEISDFLANDDILDPEDEAGLSVVFLHIFSGWQL